MRLSDAAGMRSLDQFAIQQIGIPGVVLMENAGRGTAELLLGRWRDSLTGGISVLCGPGNNGGDGYVIARHLHNAGYAVQVYLFAKREDVQGDARLNLDILERMKVPVTYVQRGIWNTVKEGCFSSRVIIDALFGTGLRSDVTGLIREVIEAVNGAGRLVLSVDIPSGLDATRGVPLGAAIEAHLTATYGLAKLGQVLDRALKYVGELVVVDISLPRDCVLPDSTTDRLMEAGEVAALLPDRPRDGHKGTFGHLLVLAGSVGKVGAAVMTCHSALRSGVGLVTLALPKSAAGLLVGLWPEVMLELLEDEGQGHLVPASLPGLEAALRHKNALALGPGLSTGPGVGEVLERLMAGRSLPTIVDADGLNALAGRVDGFPKGEGGLVITPHPGEASRLLGVSTSDVQADRVGAARRLAARTGAVAVLKGARTLTATPAGRISVNPTGNSGMGTGGAGDVLTGLIGGLLAQGLSAEEAAVCGVYLHGLAGDLAAHSLGERAMIAGDIIQHLGRAFQAVAKEEA